MRKWFIAVCVIAIAGLAYEASEVYAQMQLRQLMIDKLHASQKLLEAIAKGDFKQIGQQADRLSEIANQAEWMAYKTPKYELHSGGEALYNSHERNPRTGDALQLIGRACLIQADVPISSFRQTTHLADTVIRRYLSSRGYDTGEGWEHEDNSRDAIAAPNIVRFVFHGDAEFSTLTGCDSWKPPLRG